MDKQLLEHNMKHRTFLTGIIFMILILLGISSLATAQVTFNGDLSAVSTYVWRGIKANNGPALQSTAALSYGFVTLGFWGSSIDFGDDLEIESDVFIEVALPTGDLSTTLGATVYMFDFRTFNSYADAELEVYAGLGYGPISLGGYYVPKQNSTKGDPVRSNYWLEFSGETVLLGADVSATIAYGTYSSRWIPEEPKKDPVALLTLSAGKSLSETISVFWTYSLDLGSGFENIIYFGGSHAL